MSNIQFNTFQELYNYFFDKWEKENKLSSNEFINSPNKRVTLYFESFWYNGDDLAKSKDFYPLFTDSKDDNKPTIKKIEIDEINCMIILDECLAIKYA